MRFVGFGGESEKEVDPEDLVEETDPAVHGEVVEEGWVHSGQVHSHALLLLRCQDVLEVGVEIS